MSHSIVAFMLRPLISEGAFNALDGFFHFFEEFWCGTEGHKEYKRKLCRTGTKVVLLTTVVTRALSTRHTHTCSFATTNRDTL